MSATERRYLSIGEVLGLLQEEFPDVTISKIRFLESQGLIDPERTPSGYRKFYPGDIERLRFILREQKEHFLPLKVIRDRLEVALPDGSLAPLDAPPADDAADPALDPTPVETAPDRAPLDAPDPARGAAPLDDEPAGALEPVVTAPDPGPEPDPGDAGEIPVSAAGGEPEPAERLPVWMTHRPRARPPVAHTEVLDDDGAEPSYTAAELAKASGLDAPTLTQAITFGMVTGRTQGKDTFYGPDALAVATIVAGFARLGIEPRHLRTVKNGADREVGLYEQVILPLVKQRNSTARASALERVQALVDLGADLRGALVRQGLRQYLQ